VFGPMSPIDLDSETIQFEGGWFTRDDLARRIKAMLDGGDYNVSKPSQALEQLTATLTGLRTLAVRVTPELAESLNQAASRQGKTAGGLVREALTTYLGLPVETAPVVPAASAPSLKAAGSARSRATDPEVPLVPVVHTHSTPSPAASASNFRVTAAPAVAVVTEAASPAEAANAVDLKPKKKDDESVEKRWFGG